MSLRYTGEATMDEPALRDVERWKDKIEVRLDNRQVFFLFFGSAMVACMLFVLGVIVGKRLESRGRAEAPVIEDPLAALDRFSAPGSATPAGTALAFPRTLINNAPARTGGPGRAAEERLSAKPTLTATLPTAPKRAPAVTPASPAEAPASTSKKTGLLPHPVAAGAPVSPKASLSASSPTAPKTVALAAKPAAAPATKPVAAKAPAPGKGNFLLQLSSFQDRAEADAFARRFSGQNAYVVASEVPGKGLWYRVRVGSYGTMKDAAVAKTAFEREHGVIAYVAGSGPAQ